jgi:hypothetical protein
MGGVVSVKGTRAATARRVDVVYRLLLLGLDRQRILEHVDKKYPSWACCSRTIDNYMAKARQLMEEVGAHDRTLELGRSLARHHDCYAHLYTKGDYRGADVVQRGIDDMLGLNATKKIEVTEILTVLDDEIAAKRREVEELERQYALESRRTTGP